MTELTLQGKIYTLVSAFYIPASILMLWLIWSIRNILKAKQPFPIITNTIYVSLTGNDDDCDGSPSKPCRTLNKAMSLVKDAGPKNIYIIHVSNSQIVDSSFALKSFVSIVGNNK